MKKTISLLFVLLMMYNTVKTQTIVLKASKTKQLAVFLNGSLCLPSEKSPTVLNYTKETRIVLDLTGLDNNKTVITLKRFDLNVKGEEIRVDSTQFGSVRNLSTDQNQVLSVGQKSFSLASPFYLYMGFYGDPEKNVSIAFVPQLQGTDAEGPARQPGNNMPVAYANKQLQEEQLYQPGSVIYDALKLANSENLTESEVRKIAKAYFPSDDLDDYVKAKKKLDSVANWGNGNDEIKAKKAELRLEGKSGDDLFSLFSSSGISGMITTLADGLAKFYVKRVKQELAITLFDRMNKEISQRPALYLLFPQTTQLLNVAHNEIYEYQRYIQNIRSAVKNDLVSIPDNFPSIVDYYDAAYFSHHPFEKAALLSSCYLAGEIKKQTHIGDILAGYPTSYLDSIKDNKKILKPSVQFLQILSGSLRDTVKGETAPYWVNIGATRELVRSKRAFKLYLGLLGARVKSEFGEIRFSENFTISEELKKINGLIDTNLVLFNEVKNYVLQLGVKTDVLNKLIAGRQKTDTDSLAIEQIASYANATVDLLQYATRIQQLSRFKDLITKNDLEQLKPYFDMATDITGMITDVNRRNYAGVINKAIRTYELLGFKQDTVVVKQGNAGETMVSGDIKSKLLKYGSLIASLGMANNSDDVAQVLETAAMPVGSARIKRNADFNVSLNGYVGLYGGFEKINGDASKGTLNTFGLTAPLGVGLNWGHRVLFWKTTTEWSTSVYVSLIDIGAIAAFRFGDSLSQAPNIQLKNIVSPGLFLSLGIPKTPLSVNLGAQIGPNLRTITSSSGAAPAASFDSKTYTRYSLSFCVDIPVFNLYTK